MAIFDTSRTPVSGHLTQGAFGGFVPNMIAAVAGWAERRTTRNALHALSDRELEDIGLSRGDIDTML